MSCDSGTNAIGAYALPGRAILRLMASDHIVTVELPRQEAEALVEPVTNDDEWKLQKHAKLKITAAIEALDRESPH